MTSTPSPNCPVCCPPPPTPEQELRSNLAELGLLPRSANDTETMMMESVLAPSSPVDVVVSEASRRYQQLMAEHLQSVAGIESFRAQEAEHYRSQVRAIRQLRTTLEWIRSEYDLDQVALDVIEHVLG